MELHKIQLSGPVVQGQPQRVTLYSKTQEIFSGSIDAHSFISNILTAQKSSKQLTIKDQKTKITLPKKLDVGIECHIPVENTTNFGQIQIFKGQKKVSETINSINTAGTAPVPPNEESLIDQTPAKKSSWFKRIAVGLVPHPDCIER
jgi:hypothetical protein